LISQMAVQIQKQGIFEVASEIQHTRLERVCATRVQSRGTIDIQHFTFPGRIFIFLHV
jgi:hypothetical protein